MANFKCDNRYHAHADECAYDLSSDSDDTPVVREFTMREYPNWFEKYYDELVELYGLYKQAGDRMFGRCFDQCGSLDSFARFIYRGINI